jgi:transcription initiation factor TFIIB
MEAGGKCPNCGSSRCEKDPRLLEIHCVECGLVLTGPDLVNPLPNLSDVKEDRGGRGVGPLTSPSPYRKMLGTTLRGVKDAQGHRLAQDVMSHYNHLGWMMRREIVRGKLCQPENPEARENIARVTSKLELPTLIRDEAESIFREAISSGALRGRGLPACTGAAIYAACRKYNQPHTLSEIAAAMSIKRWEVGRAFKSLNRGLNKPVPPAGLKTYLYRYAEELALSPAVRSTVEEMLEKTSSDPEVSGLSPHGVVAALIYIAAEQHGEKVSRGEMARVGSVTEMTLRTTTKVMERLVGRPRAQ